jgi:guanosine-3',5'-bis(diphosphate) 3'-pyrophosphohydrolase
MSVSTVPDAPLKKIRFEDIQDRVVSYHPEADVDLLRRAYIFSAMAHKGQVRSSGEPYLTHPLQVAYILADLRLDVASVVAGLLHDVIEDTLTSTETIEDYFGKEVASIVQALSKISKITFTSEEEKQAENFRKMLLAMVDDIRVLLVKLADRLHNMRTLEHLSQERRERISRETLEIYAPLANRLGMGRMKQELEDLALLHLEPKGYSLIAQSLERQREMKEEYIAELRSILESKLTEAGVPAEITGRVKHIYSIYRKIEVQRIDVDRVYDYIAFRLITDTVKNCYAALGIIHGHHTWRPVPGRFKDYIAMPKANFYQSLHTSLMTDRGQPFEVQIRTREMHAVAEQGIAAHWKYKEGRTFDPREEERFKWVRKLIDWQREVKDPKEFLRAVKLDLYQEEVYTFTPKGEVFAFPKGAIAIDFAYGIHTDIGHHCNGARINGRLVPIKTKLSNGDVVEIVTAPSQHPSRDWLSYVKTTHARHKIRHWLNAQERERLHDMGKAVMEKEARRQKLSLKSLGEGPKAKEALASFGCETMDDFYIQVGYGKTSPKNFIAALVPATGESAEARPRPASGHSRAGDGRVTVSGADDVLVSLARCCQPIQGDQIVGYITLGRGVSVHAEHCPNVQNLIFDPQRKIDVDWTRGKKGLFIASLVVHTADRPGMLARLTTVIAEDRTNIRKAEARTTEEKEGRINLLLEVTDLEHLQRVWNKLKSVDGVHRVDRVAGE